MSLYASSLFLHIVGALGLCAALGLEWAGLVNLRRATEVGQVREWIRLLGAPRFLGGPAALLVFLTGVHMTAARWGVRGWILVALAGMVVIAAVGARVSGRRVGAIARALPAESGAISAALRRQLGDPVLTLSLRVRVALFLGIVFVMTTTPSTAGALAAMGVALAAGLAAGMPVRGAVRRPAPVAGSGR